MSFGSTTVTFVKITEDPSSRDRYGNPAQVTNQTDVPGCLFRPQKFTEISPVGTQQTAQTWKCTAPPVAAAMNASATDAIIVNGTTYQVIAGAEVFNDFSGPYKVTVRAVLQLY
jgi:hypothetical protein